MVRKKKFFLLLLCAAVQGCSFLGFSRPEKSGSSGRELPFQLEVTDEVNDGERLHISGSVTAKTEWSADEVLVRLSGVNAGELVEVSHLPLQAALGQERNKVIESGEKFNFALSLPSANITDYQLELIWGKDVTDQGPGESAYAERYDEDDNYGSGILHEPQLQIASQDHAGLPEAPPAVIPPAAPEKVNVPPSKSAFSERPERALELRDIKIETQQNYCAIGDCGFQYTILASLFNNTGSTVVNVTLGVGFVRLKPDELLDLSKKAAQNEERIAVPNLTLEPGRGRPVKLTLDRVVTYQDVMSPEGALKPVIRIISYEKY